MRRSVFDLPKGGQLVGVGMDRVSETYSDRTGERPSHGCDISEALHTELEKDLIMQPPFLKINYDKMPSQSLTREGEEWERGCSKNVHTQSRHY